MRIAICDEELAVQEQITSWLLQDKSQHDQLNLYETTTKLPQQICYDEPDCFCRRS